MFFKNRFKKDGGLRKTLLADAGELAEGMEKVLLALLDLLAPGTLVPLLPRSQTPAALAPLGAALVLTAPSLVPLDVDTSAPGLLTVKVYTLEHVRLPIAINNNKQILQALAVNLNSELVSQELVEAITRLEETQETLSGAVAPLVLPLIITIPNATLVKLLLYLTIEFDNNALVMEPKRGLVAALTWNQVVSFDVTRPTPYVNINLFIRLPNILVQHEVGDLLVGTIKAPLALLGHLAPIRLMHHQRVPFLHDDHEAGELTMTVEFQPHLTKHLTMEDFELLKVIGKGSFGKVMQVVKKDTKQIYALKTLRKQHIIAKMEVDHTMAERTVLARVLNPFIVPLKFSFQLPEKLYLVLSFINGGELYFHLQREGRFLMDRLRFYIAELLTALETLHQMNVIYRDLKLENILLDYQGHIALCDFGLCKLNMKDNDKTNTFCGTPEYLAPELLLNQGYTRSVDWWTLGTLLYEMLTGLPPFYDENVKTMYNKILNDPLKFPPALERTDAKDLLTKLLQKDPKMRLSDAADIKAHPFFKDIDWHKLLSKSYLPPFKPNVDSLLDTLNFDQDFTNEKPQDSVVDDFLTQSVQEKFGGWTYNGESAF